MENKLYINTGRFDKVSSTNFLNTPLGAIGNLNPVTKVKSVDRNYQVKVNKATKRVE